MTPKQRAIIENNQRTLAAAANDRSSNAIVMLHGLLILTGAALHDMTTTRFKAIGDDYPLAMAKHSRRATAMLADRT